METEKLKELYEIMFDDTLSKKDAKEFLQLVFALSTKSKKEIDELTAEVKQEVADTLDYFREEKVRLDQELEKKLSEKKLQIDNDIQSKDTSFSEKIEFVNELIKKLEKIKATPGKDGKDGIGIDGKDGYTPVKNVDYFDGKDGSPDTGEEIVDKINSLPLEEDKKIDAVHIKNLPSTKGGAVPRFLSKLYDVDVTDIENGQTLVWNSTTNKWEAGSGGGEQQYEFISGLIETPQDDTTYLLVPNIPYKGTISQITTKSASGTCTLQGLIDGVALGGTANSVSSTETSQTHSSANTFDAGDDIQIRITDNADCSFLSFTIRYVRT